VSERHDAIAAMVVAGVTVAVPAVDADGPSFAFHVTDPAWKVKPSWAFVADADKIINPDLERFYAARAHSHVVVVKGARPFRLRIASQRSSGFDREGRAKVPKLGSIAMNVLPRISVF
jgi:hypothetical protein